jgi:hypothetical protein
MDFIDSPSNVRVIQNYSNVIHKWHGLVSGFPGNKDGMFILLSSAKSINPNWDNPTNSCGAYQTYSYSQIYLAKT